MWLVELGGYPMCYSLRCASYWMCYSVMHTRHPYQGFLWVTRRPGLLYSVMSL